MKMGYKLNYIAKNWSNIFYFNSKINEGKNHDGLAGTDNRLNARRRQHTRIKRIIGYLAPTRPLLKR